MFSRRNRGFLGTCFILVGIICFGYGLYMFDLKSVKLSESQAQLHRAERSVGNHKEKIEKLKSEKSNLEKELEKEKHEHQQKTLSLELEKSERDKREQEAINSQRNYEQSKLSLSQCEQKATYSEQKYQEVEDHLQLCKEAQKESESKFTECVSQKTDNQKAEIQMKHDLEQLQQQQDNKDNKYKEELLIVNKSTQEYFFRNSLRLKFVLIC